MAVLLLQPQEERRSARLRLTPKAPRVIGWLAWPALMLLAGYLLFCHGCHGDEDNELLVKRTFVVVAHENAHER